MMSYFALYLGKINTELDQNGYRKIYVRILQLYEQKMSSLLHGKSN